MDTDRTEEEVGFQAGYERASYGVSRQELDVMGERTVRDVLNSGKWGHAGLAPFEFVSAWLKDAEFARISDDSTRRDARDTETLSVARTASFAATAAAAAASEANDIARLNRPIAITAVIIAAVAAIAAIVAAIAAVKGLH